MVTDTPYERYLHADAVLAYQKPDKDLACSAERHFAGVQIEAEFIWTRVSFLLKEVHEYIKNGETFQAASSLEYAAYLWSELTKKSEELTWRMWPNDFFKIRLVIGAGGSTADSPRFHESEKLGRKLWEPYMSLLEKKSISLKQLMKDEVKDPGLSELTKSMMYYDYRVQEFNLAHLYLVFNIIGDKTMGLKGGTTDYLVKRYEKYLFPDLWNGVNELFEDYPR